MSYFYEILEIKMAETVIHSMLYKGLQHFFFKHFYLPKYFLESHPGNFGEDLAKAICWNLTPKDRHANQRSLLEHYHFNLLKYGNFYFYFLLSCF